MKQYDIYLAMAPGTETADYMGAFAVMLLNSGLKYTRHIGAADNIAARRDVRRLLDDCNTVLYISNAANNALELSADVVDHANKQGMEIVVVKADNSRYPAEVEAILNEAPTYDATQPETRKEAFGDAVRRLGGKIDIATGDRPTTPGAIPTTGPQTETQEIDDDEVIVGRRRPSLSVLIVEIVLAVIVIAGVIALIAR